MKFARIVYWIAAVSGLAVLLPLYFLIDKVGETAPPAVMHPEFYYGFVGLAVVWQLAFIVIAREPLRYRALMPITILEKLAFTVPVVVLYCQGRVGPSILFPSLGDGVLGVLFVIAYIKTAP